MSKKMRVPFKCLACHTVSDLTFRILKVTEVSSLVKSCPNCSSETHLRLERKNGEIHHQTLTINVTPMGMSYGLINLPEEGKA